jgi:hypothetical protein
MGGNESMIGRSARALTGVFAMALCLAAAGLAAGQGTPTLPASVPVAGGTSDISFNPDALAALGLRLEAVEQAVVQTPGAPGVRHATTTFAARADNTLAILRRDGEVVGIGDGALRYLGGFALAWPGGRVDLHEFALRAGAGTSFGIDLVDARGVVWLSAERAHYSFSDAAPATFSMRHMNLRLSSRFAQALGRPQLTGTAVGGLAFEAFVRGDAPDAARGDGACRAPWPGPGLRTDIQLMVSDLSGFQDSIYAPRCGLPPLPHGGACTATSTNGRLVLSGDASMRNIGQTAVPWYAPFSGAHPPHGSDQHPYLVWNLYRIDRDGRIRQIGVSAAKHAFYSINKNCGCVGSNTFWPGCEDIYSGSNNDNGGSVDEQHLAPRAEIIPFTGQWARCGSVWDADCDGRMDPGSGARDLYQYRLLAAERDLLPPLADGAEYFFEYGYVVRDDADIYNTMGYRPIRLRKHGANWRVEIVGANTPQRGFFLGPVINRWVDPAAPPAHAANRELATPLGRARVAVRATDLGDGRWRYTYAVMNLDYAHVQVDPAHPREPDLRLLASRGFHRFGVRLPRGVRVGDLRFAGAGSDPGVDWSARVGADAVTWSAPAAGPTLDWGTLFQFEFTVNAPPRPAAQVTLTGAPTPAEAELPYTLALPGPG